MIGRSLRRIGRSLGPSDGGLALLVMAWWLTIAGTIILTVPVPATSSTPGAFDIPDGRTVRIHLPGLPSLSAPVARAAFDASPRGAGERNEKIIEPSFKISEWLMVSHGERAWIVAADLEAVQVELLEGEHRERRVWLKAQYLNPLR